MRTAKNRLIIKFALTGAVGTALDGAVFALGLALFANATLARALGYAMGTSWAFAINKKWVFRSNAGWSRAIPFSLLYLTSGSLAVALQWWVSLHSLDLSSTLVGYFLTVIIASSINCLGLKFIVFRS